MIKLIPFSPIYAPFAFQFFSKKEYKNFYNHLPRWLTINECENLPEVLKMEVLIIGLDDKCIGIIILSRHFNHVMFSIAIDIEFQRKGFFYKAIDELEDYCFNICKVEIMLTCAVEHYIENAFKKIGYLKIGKTLIKSGI